MRHRTLVKVLVFCMLPELGFAIVGRDVARAQTPGQKGGSGQPTMNVMTSVRHGVSPALRELPVTSESGQNADAHSPFPLPRFRGMEGDNGLPMTDRALQTSPQPEVPAVQVLDFDGIPVNGGGGGFVAPPDTNGAAGLTQYAQIVNLAFAVYDKLTGSLLAGPTVTKSLWTGFGGDCELRNDGDPVLLYDRAADRWFITQFAIGPFRIGVGTFLQCIAVSTTGDATGTYNLYAFDFGFDDFIDYGKFGSWPDGYYASFNTFNRTGTVFKYAKECAFDRAAMLAGAPQARAVCFNTPDNGGFLPSDLDGSILPPVGAPNPFIEIWADGPNSALAIWGFHVDFDTPANSSFGPPTILPVEGFTIPPGTVVPQAETPQRLDTLGDRLMFRLAYRNFLDHESLVVNHSVGDVSQVSVRWYEIQDPNGTPFVFQQGTFAPDATSRWMGSIAMDKAGNIAMGYSASDSSSHPSIRFTGRLSTDDPGLMGDEAIVLTGNGSQIGLSRWGDYSAITPDPVDDCTFWYTTEYIPVNGSFNWRTHVVAFVFPTCLSATASLPLRRKAL